MTHLVSPVPQPELIEDGKVYQQGDVYAFGIIMWEIFTSATPYANMAHPQIMVRAQQTPLECLSTCCSVWSAQPGAVTSAAAVPVSSARGVGAWMLP